MSLNFFAPLLKKTKTNTNTRNGICTWVSNGKMIDDFFFGRVTFFSCLTRRGSKLF